MARLGNKTKGGGKTVMSDRSTKLVKDPDNKPRTRLPGEGTTEKSLPKGSGPKNAPVGSSFKAPKKNTGAQTGPSALHDAGATVPSFQEDRLSKLPKSSGGGPTR